MALNNVGVFSCCCRLVSLTSLVLQTGNEEWYQAKNAGTCLGFLFTPSLQDVVNMGAQLLAFLVHIWQEQSFSISWFHFNTELSVGKDVCLSQASEVNRCQIHLEYFNNWFCLGHRKRSVSQLRIANLRPSHLPLFSEIYFAVTYCTSVLFFKYLVWRNLR